MFSADTLALLIPITALMIPIVAILTKHQQQMAEMYHRGANVPQTTAEIAALRSEVRELKELVHSQILANEMNRSRSVAPGVDLEQRLGSGS